MAGGLARRTTRTAVIIAASVTSIVVINPAAFAKFAESSSGSGTTRAIQLATPTAPTAMPSSLLILTCTVSVSWSAPPSGQQYTIYRVVNGTPTAWQSNQTAAGTNVTDTFVLSGLFARDITYFIRSSLIAATTWIQDSSSTPVHC